MKTGFIILAVVILTIVSVAAWQSKTTATTTAIQPKTAQLYVLSGKAELISVKELCGQHRTLTREQIISQDHMEDMSTSTDPTELTINTSTRQGWIISFTSKQASAISDLTITFENGQRRVSQNIHFDKSRRGQLNIGLDPEKCIYRIGAKGRWTR